MNLNPCDGVTHQKLWPTLWQNPWPNRAEQFSGQTVWLQSYPDWPSSHMQTPSWQVASRVQSKTSSHRLTPYVALKPNRDDPKNQIQRPLIKSQSKRCPNYHSPRLDEDYLRTLVSERFHSPISSIFERLGSRKVNRTWYEKRPQIKWAKKTTSEFRDI